MTYLLIHTTCDSQSCAESIITALLETNLAACIHQGTTTSHYVWKDKQQKADEITLTIKTREALWPQVEQTIRQNHTYETPEIIACPITHGHASYLNWINEVTHG